jgi:hypothetical protein
MKTYDIYHYNSVKDVLKIINVNRHRYEAGTRKRWGVKLGKSTLALVFIWFIGMVDDAKFLIKRIINIGIVVMQRRL